MKPSRHRLALIALLALPGFLSVGCGHGSGRGVTGINTAAKDTRLNCGKTAYRISADRIDGEVTAACERVQQSSEEMRTHNAARTRFTCTDSTGHVVLSAPVPTTLLEAYDHSCQQYLAADRSAEGGGVDRQAHFAALRQFQDETRRLVTQTVDESNAIWRRNKADQASLNKLVRSRGGSIEIQD